MAYPSAVGTFTNPNPTQRLNSPSQSSIVAALNAAIVEIETFVGTLSSAVGTLVYDIRSSNSNGGGHIQTANKGGTGQTAYTKGDILVASSSSVLAKLSAGSDGQVLTADTTAQTGLKWGTNNNTLPTARTVVPMPVLPIEPGTTDTVSNVVIDSNISSVFLGQVVIPFSITANKITVLASGPTGNATMDITMYQESGAASVFTVTTSQIGNGTRSVVTAIPGASIAAGVYYIAVNGNNQGASVETALWNTDGAVLWGDGFANNVAGKPVINGWYPTSPGVPPSSITTTAIDGTTVNQRTLAFRLDT